jgi:ABC-2 type transport system ATP-binding protein
MDLTARARDGVHYSGGMRAPGDRTRAPRPAARPLPRRAHRRPRPGARQHLEHHPQLRDLEQVTIVLTTTTWRRRGRLRPRRHLNEGRIIALDTPRALLESLGGEVLELQVDGDPQDAVAALLSLEAGEPQVIGRTVTVPIRNGSRDTGAIIEAVRHAGVSLAAVAVRRSTLNDVFMRLTAPDTPVRGLGTP